MVKINARRKITCGEGVLVVTHGSTTVEGEGVWFVAGLVFSHDYLDGVVSKDEVKLLVLFVFPFSLFFVCLSRILNISGRLGRQFNPSIP
jgi:hypothetical protein